ncbi:MAG: alpha/beta hydrolase, partial [Planctomycetota bacterium]|nr:alpha/beta hydrolase [Planctomycetota bacterium]
MTHRLPSIVVACFTIIIFLPQPSAAEFTKSTYVYKTVDGTKIEADVFRENDKKKRPVIVWIHGGALIVGSRTSIPGNLLELAKTEGYTLVSIDYRLAPEVKADAIKEDVVDAFRWIHKEGPKLFNADTQKIVVTGGSAGGYLTMLVGCSVSPRPTALVAYWGYGDVDGAWMTHPTDFYKYETPIVGKNEALSAVGGDVLTGTEGIIGRARGLYYRYLRQRGLWAKTVVGADPATEPETFKPFCPIQIIPDDYPPILMVHGKNDTDVPYEKSSLFAKELQRRGLPHELVTVPAAGHGLSGGDPELIQAAHQRALEFIREQMKT